MILVSVGHETRNLAPLLGEPFIELEKLVVFLGCPGLNFSLVDVEEFLFNFDVEMFPFLGEQRDDKLSFHSSIVRL